MSLRSRDYTLFSLNRETFVQRIYIFDTMLNQRVCLGIEKKHHVITFKAFKTNVKKCNAASTSP